MQFSKFIAAAATFAVALAQVKFTDPSFNSITAGQPFNLTWTGADGPVTLTLKNGPPTALVTVSTIASGLTGTSFIWNVPATLTADTYAIQITDSSGTPNYSTQFQLIGGVTASSSAVSSTSSAFSASSSAATVTSSSGLNSTSTTTGSSSSKTSSAASKTSSEASSTGSKTTSATGSSSSTSAPSSASGLSSPLAFVFLALAAILTLN